MGSPVLPVRQAELPRSRFHCRLDDQPDHLVPEHCLRTASWADRSDLPLFVNPRARFTRHGELPEQLVGHSWLLDNFALQADMVWLCDPGPEALQPFWLGTRFRGFLAGVSPGDRAPTVLSPEARRILGMANVLVPANFESQRRQDWSWSHRRFATPVQAARLRSGGSLDPSLPYIGAAALLPLSDPGRRAPPGRPAKFPPLRESQRERGSLLSSSTDFHRRRHRG